MQTIARRIITAVFALALVAASSFAWAYRSCESSVTVYASGGQSCSTTCHFYDNETGNYQGSMSMEYQC